MALVTVPATGPFGFAAATAVVIPFTWRTGLGVIFVADE
jgi:hypothetical protein